MTTSISERANAYRAALRLALNDGLSIQVATMAAKKAAREVSNFPMPPKPPVMLTDEELRLIDENELTADECDRLDELDQAAVNAEEKAFNATLPKGKSSILEELATALGYRVIEIPLSDFLSLDNADTDFDEGDDPNCECGCEDRGGSDDCPACSDPFCMGDCPSEDTMTDALGPDHYGLDEPTGPCLSEELKAHGNEPKDLGDFGAGTLADAWRDGVSIVTPAGLRLKALAAFTAGIGLGHPRDYVDYGEDLSHEEKVAAGMPDCVGADEGCQCESCHEDDAAEWAAEERRHQAERDEECPTTRRVRDCDIPATLRAIELPATEDHNSYRLWFDGDDEMNQFLAGRCLYAGADRSIKDREGKDVGMWFYAHFGPTPVS